MDDKPVTHLLLPIGLAQDIATFMAGQPYTSVHKLISQLAQLQGTHIDGKPELVKGKTG